MATKDQKNNLSRAETKRKARDLTESATNANDTQRKNMARSLIRKGRRKGMSDDDIVKWLKPIFQPGEKKEKPTDTAKTQQGVGTQPTEGVGTQPTERVTTSSLVEWTPVEWAPVELTPTPEPAELDQWATGSDVDSPEVQGIDVLSSAVSSSISTMPPSVLALSLQQGKITQQDFDTLSATNPELYSQAVLFKQQLELQNSINAKWAELVQASENLANTYAERARNIWGETAVDEYNSFVGDNRFARQMKEKAETIAQIDDSLDFIQEDTEDEVGSWNLWYILAKADKWRRELHRERSLLVSEYNALKTQADYEYNQWLEKYKVFRAAEDQKMQISMQYAQARYWIAQEQYQMSVAETNNKLQQLASISEDVTDFYDQKRAEQLSIQEQEEAMVAMEQMQLTNQAILSLYNGISIEDKAVLSTLPTESVQAFLKQYNEASKVEKPIIHKTGDNWYVAIDPSTWKPLYEHKEPVAWSLDGNVTNAIVEGERWGECGTRARTVAGMAGLPWGNNLQERINQFSEKTPQVWGMILFNGTWATDIGNNKPIMYDTEFGHIALIESVNPDGTLNISESNLKDDEKISRRTISPSDPAISGYYNKTPLARAKVADIVVSWAAPLALGLSSDSAKRFSESLEKAVDSWNRELALNTIREAYRATLSTSGKQALDSRWELSFRISELWNAFEEYVAKGGDLWFFTGKTEDMLNNAGRTSDPELAALQIRVVNLLDNVARDRTGAAMTESEEMFYQRLLPWIGKTIEYNRWIVNGLQQSLWNQEKYVDFVISEKMTKEAKDWLYSWQNIDFIDDWVKKVGSLGELYIQMWSVTNSSWKSVPAESYFEQFIKKIK